MDEIADALSELLSLRSSSNQLNSALSRLNTLLAGIALDRYNAAGLPSSKAEFIASQDSFLYNVTSRLIEFSARCLLRLQNHKYGDDYQTVFSQLGQAMKLLQGFLLLHGESRKLFGLRCNIELLVTCLTLPDHASSTIPATPSLATSAPAGISASPTLASIPFDFAASTSTVPGEPDAPPTLAEITLETLLCALVDTPTNVKAFEEANGIGEVVRILRGKVAAGRGAKIKALEFLYFWLYPDRDVEPAQAKPGAAPSTPKKASSAARVAMHPKPLHREATDIRLRAMLETAHDSWSPQTPSKPSRTFEHTQLALSRSAAAAGISPRKRLSRVSFDEEADPNDVYDSPRAKRPASFSPSLAASRPAPRSPEAKRRSILGSSGVASASISNVTPPTTPNNRLSKSARRPSLLARSAMEQSAEQFKLPRPPLTPSKSLATSRQTENAATPESWASSDFVSSRVEYRQVASAPAKRIRPVFAQDLPGNAGMTKGLFESTTSLQDAARRSTQNPTAHDDRRRDGTSERRRALLAKYVGNAEQLMERFDGLRCTPGQS